MPRAHRFASSADLAASVDEPSCARSSSARRCARRSDAWAARSHRCRRCELATTVLRALLDRTGLDPAAVDGVIGAQGYPTMEAPAFGRVAALDAGFPVTTTGYQLDRRCGSGLQAVLNAAMEVQTGVADVVIALGAESMSNAPLYTVEGRRGIAGAGLMLHDALARGRATVGGSRFPTPDGNVGAAEVLRAEYGISRDGAGRPRAALAPAGGRRPGVGRVRRRARAGGGAGPARHRDRRPRRAPPRRHLARGARRPAAGPRPEAMPRRP